MFKVCDIQQFIKRTEYLDEIICYGAGKQLECFVELFKDTVVLSKCSGVADRDKEKQGTIRSIENIKFPVISPEQMKRNHKSSSAVVITCIRFEEIIDYFESDEILKEMDFYCLHYFKLFQKEKGALNKAVPSDFRIHESAVIPKVIHYCWFGKTPMPDKYKRWMESWHRFCPDYEIKEWNESNYDISKNRYMEQAYENKKWGFVPDYARLDIIYQNGGIYLDTDVELVANLDDLLYQDGFMCYETETRVNCGMGFGAVKGLNIIKDMRDDYNGRSFLKEDGSLNLTPSPNIQTNYLKKRGLLGNGEYQIIDGLTIYPEKVLGGKNLMTRKIELLPYTKSIHHFDGSWLDGRTIARVNKLEKGISMAEEDEDGK